MKLFDPAHPTNAQALTDTLRHLAFCTDPSLETVLDTLSLIEAATAEDPREASVNDWVRHELTGYPHDAVLPNYRVIRVALDEELREDPEMVTVMEALTGDVRESLPQLHALTLAGSISAPRHDVAARRTAEMQAAAVTEMTRVLQLRLAALVLARTTEVAQTPERTWTACQAWASTHITHGMLCAAGEALHVLAETLTATMHALSENYRAAPRIHVAQVENLRSFTAICDAIATTVERMELDVWDETTLGSGMDALNAIDAALHGGWQLHNILHDEDVSLSENDLGLLHAVLSETVANVANEQTRTLLHETWNV